MNDLINPDEMDPEDVISEVESTKYWIVIERDTTRSKWLQWIGDCLPGKWVIYDPQIDKGRVVTRDRCLLYLRRRYPDCEITNEDPEGLKDD